MQMIYEQYFIENICGTLNLLENQSLNTFEGDISKKWAFSKILFGCSTIFSPLEAAKLCWRQQIYDLQYKYYKNTHTQLFYDTHIHLWHPYQHTHTHNVSNLLYNIQKQKTGIKPVFAL